MGHVKDRPKYCFSSEETPLEKKQTTEVIDLARPNESELIVPLRKAWSITRFKRAPRAMQIIKDHVIQHLKVKEDEEVWIDPSVNEHIWSRGIENPPRKVRLQVIRHDEPDIPIEVKLFQE